MKAEIPGYIQAGFAALTLICAGLVLYGLKMALHRYPWAEPKKKKVFYLTLVLLTLYLALTGFLSYQGVFYDFTLPPKMFFVLIFCLIVILIITFSKGFTELLKFVLPSWLIYIQFFRVPVELLLWALFLEGLLPVQMTFEGRNFDVLVGLTAPIIGWYCFRHGKIRKTLLVVWNILGLGLLLNIVTIAILSMPVPFRVFMNEPANTVVTLFPVVWLPVFLVPLAYSMHFFSLRQLAKWK